jgi:uroporphyrinogen-III synthase
MATERAVELARHLRRQATAAEKLAWELLRARRCEGMKFKLHEPLGELIVDLYCRELKLVIELDGAVHDEPEQAAKDRLRTEELEVLGVTVVRGPNKWVGSAVLQQIVF